MSLEFPSIRAAIFDMDGVLWRTDEILPGVAEFFAFLQRQHIAFVFATNNSAKTVNMYVERLNNIGIPAQPEQIITSAVATAEYVSRHCAAKTPVYVVGEVGIRQALAARGYYEDPERAELVIVGLDRELTYHKLAVAMLRINAGAEFIGTNGDRTIPIPTGLAPGSGSILAAIQAATGVEPHVIGKPETAMFEFALQHLGISPGQALMIGDRLETDILGAQRAGIRTALMLTGITTAAMAQTSSIQADGVFETLIELQAIWETAL